jgi:predicted membrane protein
MKHSYFGDIHKISAIGVTQDLSISGFMRDLKQDLEEAREPLNSKTVFFQKLIEGIHIPVFVLDIFALETLLQT